MPDNAKIFTTAAILENEKVTQAGVTDVPMFPRSERKVWVDNYWKNVDMSPGKRRRIFPVEYAQLSILFKKSSDVAFIVYNINNPNKVTGKWVAFSSDKPPKLSENSRCFVLSKQYYDGTIKVLNSGTSDYTIRGLERIKQDKNNPATAFLLALIGKDDAGNYALFLQSATATLLDKDPGGGFDTVPGGEGASGIKIPRPS